MKYCAKTYKIMMLGCAKKRSAEYKNLLIAINESEATKKQAPINTK
jgi:hypothetical protein